MFGFQIKHGQAGQALVEAALALPVLLMLSFLMIDVGTGFFVRNTLNNVARDEARILATDPKLNPNYRPPAGVAQTPQAAVAQAISDAKTRITIRIAPIAGMGNPLSVNDDGIQILVPGVNGVPGNLTDNPVEVRITRQLNLISANFIPDAVADRIINTSVSASAFVEKGTLSGDINLVTEDGRSITTETDLCTEGQICTCETDRTLCKPEELCTILGECTEQQRCDLLGNCSCKTKISLCKPEELCTVRGDANECCKLYGGVDGTGKNPQGQDACSPYQRCNYFNGAGTDECCKLNINWCNGDWCERYAQLLSTDPTNPTYIYWRDYHCCYYNTDPAYPYGSPLNPYCCAVNASICYNDSKRCELNDIQACCRLAIGEPGAEKCNCQNDINRCEPGGVCIYHPGSDQCCQVDPTKCNGEQLCRLKGQLDKCTDCQKCQYYSANDPDACCRCNINKCSNSNICTYYKTSTQCRCLEGVGTVGECCALRKDYSLTCCQDNINFCKPEDVCSVYPDQPKCKVEG